jgi:hypothetical protein
MEANPLGQGIPYPTGIKGHYVLGKNASDSPGHETSSLPVVITYGCGRAYMTKHGKGHNKKAAIKWLLPIGL